MKDLNHKHHKLMLDQKEKENMWIIELLIDHSQI